MKKNSLPIRVSNMRGTSSVKNIDIPKYMRFNFAGAERHVGFLVIQHNGKKFERVEINMDNGSFTVKDLVLTDAIIENQLERSITLEQMEAELKEAGHLERWNKFKE
jgi:hypothetical protein